MKLAIMQPYFMPYIGYFQAMAAVDKYLLYDKVAFIKKGWINRNRIYIQNVGTQFITIPLKNKSSFTNILDVHIDNTTDWRSKMLNLIYYNYKRSLFFDVVYPLMENSIKQSSELISEYNFVVLNQIATFLDINTPIELCTDPMYEGIEQQLATYDDSLLRKYDRIKFICQANNADNYINPIGGQELYDKQIFAQQGITLNFVQTQVIPYPQLAPEFIPNLSIIDVLMHNGKAGTKQLLNAYTLI